MRGCSSISRPRPRESPSDRTDACERQPLLRSIIGHMPGVSWSERGPTDWLASNGRWYEQSKYPHGWSTSALPPAPGHGGVGSILRRFTGTASPEITVPTASSFSVDGTDEEFSAGWSVGSDASTSTSTSTPTATSNPTATPAGPRVSVVPTGRRVASATITEPSPRPPAPTKAVPAPPGRLGALPTAAPPMPAPPTNTPNAQPPAPAPQSTSFDVVAGDLGKVLGTAKRRIEKAINDSAQS